MKILVIPDIHARPFWKDAVEKHFNDVDRIIFLGDEVDPYPDEGYNRKEAINTLKDIISFKAKNSEKVILLIGNHAAHYFNRNFIRSSRYDSSNAYKLNKLYNDKKSLFKLAHEEIINGKHYLFTHAGLMNSWASRNKKIIGEPTVENLNKLMDSNVGISVLSEVSKYRTWIGEESGSILWSDLREKIKDVDIFSNKVTANEDSIVNGYDYQIFGHTLIKEPVITDKWACLDCKKAFILDDEGNITEA